MLIKQMLLSHTDNKPQIMQLIIRKTVYLQKTVFLCIYMNIKNGLPFLKTRNLSTRN